MLDTADQVADVLSEQGVPDHHIAIGFGVVAAISLAAYYLWWLPLQESEETLAQETKEIESSNTVAAANNTTLATPSFNRRGIYRIKRIAVDRTDPSNRIGDATDRFPSLQPRNKSPARASSLPRTKE